MNPIVRAYSLVLSLLLTVLITFNANGQERSVITLTNNWKFKLGSIQGAERTNYDDSSWEQVRVPHDWAIEQDFEVNGDGNTGKLPWKGEGWYRRFFNVPEIAKNQKVYLLFDGVMAFPQVYVNGKFAGSWDYGYNSFYLDITDHINASGENLLAVHANTNEHDSRWYPGAGIYRKVQLITVNPVHVGIWGTYITTPIIKPHYAAVRIRTDINNALTTRANIQIQHEIVNPDGVVVVKETLRDTLAVVASKILEANVELLNPKLWDINNPELYSLQTTVKQDGKVVDRYSSRFGVRSTRFTADDGFYLNNKRVQLKGVNLHHDHGPLGAAFNKRSMERKLQIMKEMGVNAIRNSHNVAAPELAQLCDEMGLLFFNEIFDKYDQKAGIVDSTNFESFAHRNIRNFIKRDRNHPSIFLWSVGNEIGDVQWNLNSGFHRLHTMVNYVNKYDPTRPVTLVCDNLQSAELRHFDYYDVHAWNYGRRYRLARKLEPNKSVIISESASTLSTRGFYELPLPDDKTNFTKSLQVSSYDLNAPYWAEIADDDFMWQQDEPYVAGEFVWTGFDYLGEPTPYTNRYVKELGMTESEASRSSYFGIVDLVGLPKDRYYLYKSYWQPDNNMVHILPHWNWKNSEYDSIPVFVYTNGDCAELFVNGKSMGKRCKKPTSNNSVDRFRLMWESIKYEPGEVKAIAYKEGKKIAVTEVKTTGPTKKIRLLADRSSIAADGEDLSFITVEAIDKDGNVHPLADDDLTISVKGGELAGAGNGNPQSFDPMQDNKVQLFYGKAVLIIRSASKGKATVAVDSKTLGKASLTIELN